MDVEALEVAHLSPLLQPRGTFPQPISERPSPNSLRSHWLRSASKNVTDGHDTLIPIYIFNFHFVYGWPRVPELVASNPVYECTVSGSASVTSLRKESLQRCAPSAGEACAVEARCRERGAPALFIASGMNPALGTTEEESRVRSRRPLPA